MLQQCSCVKEAESNEWYVNNALTLPMSSMADYMTQVVEVRDIAIAEIELAVRNYRNPHFYSNTCPKTKLLRNASHHKIRSILSNFSPNKI